MESVEALLETALEAARAASRIHESFRGTLAVADATEKGPADFVSHVDLKAQEAVSEIVRERFPTHHILSEEEDPDPTSRSVVTLDEVTASAPRSLDDPPLWIVDPLDGTTNFLHGHPLYAASVGVTVEGRSVAGAVVAGATGEEWTAATGLGAYRNGSRIRVSGVEIMRQALVGTGFPFKRMGELSLFLRQMESILPSTSGIRRGGSAALDLCYLAQGSLDAFWECHLDPWDVAAGVIILEEAGGVSGRIGGEDLDVWMPGSVIAANGPQMREALEALLASAREENT